MAFQALIGRHFKGEDLLTLDAYLQANDLVTEDRNGECFVRKNTDPSGHRRFILLKRDYAGISEAYLGKVVDPTETDLDAELLNVNKDLPECKIYFW